MEGDDDKSTTGPRDGLPRRKDALARSTAVEMSGYIGGDIADMLLKINNIINILRRSPCSLVFVAIFSFIARDALHSLSRSSPLSPFHIRSASSHASPTARGPHSFVSRGRTALFVISTVSLLSLRSSLTMLLRHSAVSESKSQPIEHRNDYLGPILGGVSRTSNT